MAVWKQEREIRRKLDELIAHQIRSSQHINKSE